MKSDDWDFTRASAALALAEINADEAIDDILESLSREKESYVRKDMIRAVHKFRDIKSLPVLFDLIINDEDWEVRKQVALTLGWLASPQTVEILVSVLQSDPHLFVKQEAENSFANNISRLQISLDYC